MSHHAIKSICFTHPKKINSTLNQSHFNEINYAIKTMCSHHSHIINESAHNRDSIESDVNK